MYKRGFHQIGEAFYNEIRVNQNLVAINSPHEAFLQAWWGKFYEAYNSKFPDVPVFAGESFDKVAQTLETIVGNNGPANQSYASDLVGTNISNVMPEIPKSSGPDLMDAKISALLSSLDAGYVLPDLSPQRDVTSGLHFPEMSEMGDMLPFASNSGYQMQQMATVPPEWNARVDIPGANLGEPMQVEPNIHVAANTLPALSELSDAGNSFKEISNLHMNSKLLCCHFNSEGELLATAGHDRKVLIWELGNNNVYSGEGHAHHVTDIRFRPNSTVFATSSFDRTVKIWDAAAPSNPFQNLVGHVEHVMSIDFHPTKVGLLGSCDSNDDIILWDVSSGDSKLIFKGGSRQVRFQPRLGDLLASSTGNVINIFDLKTNNIQRKLQGHIKDIRSICWDMSGNFLASVSEDSARIWSVSEGKCLHELCSSGNKFQSCTFHPAHAQVLVIGSLEFLELWNPIFQSSITQSYSAHAGIISSLADSLWKGTIASVSHDQWIKIWR